MSRFKSAMVNTTAIVSQAPDMPFEVNPAAPPYTPEDFIGLDIGDYRTRFPKETAGYDDITLYNVAMLPEDDMADNEWSELFLKHQPTQELSEEAGVDMASRAATFAAKVSASTEAALDKAADGKEDWQGGPIIVLAGLLSDFGTELNGWPKPGSKDGNNPDKYKAQYTDKATGNTSMRPTSFYLQFTRGTPKGQALVTEMEYLRRLGNIEAIKTDIPSELAEKYSADGTRKVRLAWVDNRLKNMAAGYRKAVALHLQGLAFNELQTMDDEGKIKQGSAMWDYIYVTDDAGEDTDVVVNSPTPIMIWAAAGFDAKGNPRAVKPGESKAVSIGAFLKFKCDVALKAGGSYKALLKTVERAPKSKDKSKTADTKTETVDQFVSRFVEGHRFMDEMQTGTDPTALAKLYSVLKTDRDSKDGGELVVSWMEQLNYMKDVAEEMQLAAAYVKIVARAPNLKTRKAA